MDHTDRDRFLLQCHDLVWSIALQYNRRTKGLISAEDFAQEAFVRLLKQLGNWDPQRGGLTNFVMLNARNAMSTMIVVERRRGLTPTWANQADFEHAAPAPVSLHDPVEEGSPRTLLHVLPSPARHPEEIACQSQLAARLDAAVRELDPVAQETLARRYGDDLGDQQQADLLGVSRRTVVYRNTNALRTLQAQLAPYRDALLALAS